MILQREGFSLRIEQMLPLQMALIRRHTKRFEFNSYLCKVLLRYQLLSEMESTMHLSHLNLVYLGMVENEDCKKKTLLLRIE